MSIDEKIRGIVERFKKEYPQITSILVFDEAGMPIFCDSLPQELCGASGVFMQELYEKAKLFEKIKEEGLEPDVIELDYTHFALVVKKEKSIFVLILMRR